jgi:hypothetical protein
MEGRQVEGDTGQRLPNRRCETLMMSFGSAFVPRLFVVVAALRLSAISLLDSFVFWLLIFDACFPNGLLLIFRASYYPPWAVDSSGG